LPEAAAAYRRIELFLRGGVERLGGLPEAFATEVWDEFTAAMNDDLAVPRALSVVFDAVREGNAALDSGDTARFAALVAAVARIVATLGLDPLTQWREAGGSESLRTTIAALVTVALSARETARERRDFAAADGIRDALARAGVVVEDTADGPRWRLE
jgi:cysteinyl-tRNA synthetase